MIDYQFTMPTKVYGGAGRSKEIGKILKNKTDKVLLVYGGGSIKKNGLYDTVCSSLESNGIAWEELSGIHSNPTLDKVYEGIDIVRKSGISYLLAVGGGSVIDTAKSIGIGAHYDGDVWDFYSNKAEITESLPVASILTIPGSGSESSANCVLSNDETKEKIGKYSEFFRPEIAILDPQLCTTIPANQIAPGIYDAFTHTLERYITTTMHTDIDDGVSESVMKGLLRNGRAVKKDHTDVEAWSEVMLGADLAHNWLTGIGRKQDWSGHPLEEVISGFYPALAHGAGLSIVTPAWMRYIYKKHLPMFVQFAVNVMRVEPELKNPKRTALAGIEALEDFSREMGLPLRFSEVGINDERFKEMAERACGQHRNGTIGTLEPIGPEQVEEIYRSVL